MWYNDLYRRHLLDMHIEDWNDDFLSQFSPKDYVCNLKKANINYAMIYLQSHAGLCYFPTKSGTVHRLFEKKPDLIKKTIELCRENGIRVIGYYSLVYNTREHDKHPDWRLKGSDGLSNRERAGELEKSALAFTSAKAGRYGHVCPSNMDYRRFTFEQIDEMLDYFDIDALFFDMPFWPHTCYCDSCQKLFAERYGQDKSMPKEPVSELIEFKAYAMGDFIKAVTDHVKSRRPDMPVEHNFASSVAGDTFNGCSEEVLAQCDYVGGDLYGDLYNHAFACKFYKNATENPPFEQMFSRCKPALRMHTLTKTYDEMKTAMASTMAHHGATLVIDAIDPIGTMDSRVYDQVGKIFEFQMGYEPYFTGDMVEETGLYYGMRSRLPGKGVTSLTACAQAGRTLSRAHIPFGVTGCFHDLTGYRIIAAPMLSSLESKDNARITAYVENGGILYLSGCGNSELVKALTGNRFIENSIERNLYVAPKPGFESIFSGFTAKYPIPFEESAPMVEPGANTQVIATLTFPYTKPDDIRFAAIHSDPPGVPTDIPAVTVTSYGKGKVIWSALPFENMPYEEHRQAFLNLLHFFGKPDYFFSSDAPVNVDITAFRNENSVTVNLVVMDEEAITRPALPFTVKVRCKAKQVLLLPEKTSVDFRIADGCTVFTTRQTDIFDMYELVL